MQWYVVHTSSGFEGRVKESLEERIQRNNLGEYFGEILVPIEAVVEMREGQKRRVNRKFYPGYMLVQMEMNENTWHVVNSVPRVLGFIGGSPARPTPISDEEVSAIVERMQEGISKPRPRVLYETGEIVRVTGGPFNDFNGVVEEVDYEKNRLQVTVQIFGRSTPVELAFSQVEKT